MNQTFEIIREPSTVSEALEVMMYDLAEFKPDLIIQGISVQEILENVEVQGFLKEFGDHPWDTTNTAYFGKNDMIIELTTACLDFMPKDVGSRTYASYIRGNSIERSEQDGRHDLNPNGQYYTTQSSRPDLDPNVLTLADMVYTWMQKMTDKTFEFFQNKFMAEYTPAQIEVVIDFISAKKLGLALDSFTFAKEAKELIKKGEMAPDDFIKRHQRRYQVQEFQKILNYIFGEQ